MNEALINSVSSQWARLGVMLNVQPAGHTPDLERLLLDTARLASQNSRLFILSASWLARNGEYVARHILAKVIREELSLDDQPTLGFMLDWAQAKGGLKRHFQKAIEACAPAFKARPLSDLENDHAQFARLAEMRASKLSRKWGRWMMEFEPKDDALRPVEWIAGHNPSLADRAIAGGDLMASVLVACAALGGSVKSESELARQCDGASRSAIRDALRRLRLGGRVRLEQQGKFNTIRLISTGR